MIIANQLTAEARRRVDASVKTLPTLPRPQLKRECGRRALKAAAGAVNRRIRFPFRGEDGSLSFYLEGRRGRRGRRAAAAAPGAEGPKRKRGRPRKATS
jgi:hypothetical protein